ncbi:MAG: CdaR family protein [candidate division Zixibacteria bacterium]|nr:CdaR family protein [candidate division Zixibacteria bacterium]
MKFKLFKNIWIKIFALILGFLLWLHVATEKTYNHEINLPISDIVLKDNLSLASEIPDSITVVVNATGKQLLRKKWRSRGLRINASQFQAGRHNLTLSIGNTFLTISEDEITLGKIISPTSLQIYIDQKLDKKIKVIADLTTFPDPDYAVDKITAPMPNEITITGPRILIRKIDSIKTEHRLLTGLRNDITLNLPLVPPKGNHIFIEPDSVTIDISVVPVKTKLFESIPVVIYNSPSDKTFNVEPSSIKLELTGSPGEIDRISSDIITASIDYLQIDSNHFAPIKVVCPPRFIVKNQSDKKAKVLIKE